MCVFCPWEEILGLIASDPRWNTVSPELALIEKKIRKKRHIAVATGTTIRDILRSAGVESPSSLKEYLDPPEVALPAEPVEAEKERPDREEPHGVVIQFPARQEMRPLPQRSCVACREPVAPFEEEGKEIDPSPWCRDCWKEKKRGEIPWVTDTPAGLEPMPEDHSPWQDNAIRHLEE